MSRRLRVLAVAALLLAGSGVGVIVTAPAASADVQICEQFGTTTIGGRYVVMNNRWGSSQPQCINVTSTGFSIIQQDGTGNTSGAPVSYPAVYLGCHYSNCSPGSPLPARIGSISSANTSISNSYPSSGTYDAAYDIWLNADTNVSGVQDTEIMIWLHHTGVIQPVGSNTGQTVNIAGRSWQVWTGNNGQNNVVSYVQSGITSLSFNAMDFIRDTLNRGSQYGNTNWYLTSMQAGFEPWIGGVGLSVNNFSATINGGATSSPTSSPTRSPTSSPTGGTGGPGACAAAYSTVNAWSGGFQGGVTVRNTGSTGINGWSVSGSLPSGATITQIWNGTLSSSGSNFTVRNVSYNGSIPGGGTTSFGFIASGSAPGSLSLSCSSS
jgi:Glycosyl hydrolase family 12/Cellulose binding domain